MRPQDTHARSHDVQLGVYRRMTPERRAEIALAMSDAMRRVARESIRRRHPEYSDEDVLRGLVALLYGKGTARLIWPDAEPPAP